MDKIVILTPYSAQRDKILMMVKDLDKILSDLKVACITESQGDFYVSMTTIADPLRQ